MRPHEIDLRKPLADHPLNAGVRGFWLSVPQLHGGGRLWDLSGRGLHGVLTNGPTWTAGQNGFGAVQFTGTDDSVAVPSSTAFDTEAGALRVVVRFANNTDWQAVAGRASSGSQGGVTWYAGANSLNVQAHWFIRNVGGGGVASGSWPAVPIDGRWRVLSLSWSQASGGACQWWLDGVSAGTTTTSGAWTFDGQVVRLGKLLDTFFTDPAYTLGAAVWLGRASSTADEVAWLDQFRRGFPDLLRRVRPRSWSVLRDDPGGGGGGTDYEEDYAGSCTPTGALARAVSKAIAGSATPSGALARLTAKPLAGSATAAGTLAKLAAKPLAGSATPTGTLTRSTGKAVAGSATATGTAAKAVAKPLAGSSTGTGDLGNVTVKLLDAAGSCTATGAETHAVAKAVGGSATATGAAAKAVSKPLAGGAQPTGSLAKRADKSLAGSSTPSGVLGTVRAALLAVGGAVTGAGGLVRAAWKALAGAATGVGSLSTSGGSVAVPDPTHPPLTWAAPTRAAAWAAPTRSLTWRRPGG